MFTAPHGPFCIGNQFNVGACYGKRYHICYLCTGALKISTLYNQIKKKYQFSSKNSSCPQFFMISHTSYQKMVSIGEKLRVRFPEPILPIKKACNTCFRQALETDSTVKKWPRRQKLLRRSKFQFFFYK